MSGNAEMMEEVEVTSRRGRTGTLKAKRNQWEMQQKQRMSEMFLDPRISGAGGVAAFCVAMFVLFLTQGYVMVAFDRLFARFQPEKS